MSFATGENVGSYRIVEKLGQGGMATVYKAYHPSLDRYVALKVLHPAFLEDPNFLARFQREARIVARLDHPHIVPIYDFAEHQGQPYLVMRFIEGETLKARLQRGRLDAEETLRVLEAVGSALTYAHRQGILHRDIKPSNIILTPGGQIYLTDFGLARMAEAGETTLSRDMMVGTPQYISPEQARAEPQLDARTDIYSLGVVLYEMLVGRVPYQADTPYAIVHDHIFTPLPLPRSLNPALSEPIERALLKALAKDPADRFATIAEMVAAFREALGTPPAETVAAPAPTVAVPAAAPEAVPPTPTGPQSPPPQPVVKVRQPVQRRKRRWPWVVVGVIAFLCLCLGMLAVLSGGQERRRPPLTPSSPVAPLPPAQLMEEARAATTEGNAATAVSLYEQAIQADPHLVDAYLEAGDLLFKSGDLPRAMALYERGLAANPENPQLHWRRAELALSLEDWEAANEELTWMQQAMPGSALPHAYAALLALAQGKPCTVARPELENARQLDPQSPWVHLGFALCAYQEGDLETAQRELEMAAGQDELSPFLRQHIEELAGRMGLQQQIAVAMGCRDLLLLSLQIPDANLRREFRTLAEAARLSWAAGERERTIQALEDARTWLTGHWDQVGEPLATELNNTLSRTLEIAATP